MNSRVCFAVAQTTSTQRSTQTAKMRHATLFIAACVLLVVLRLPTELNLAFAHGPCGAGRIEFQRRAQGANPSRVMMRHLSTDVGPPEAQRRSPAGVKLQLNVCTGPKCVGASLGELQEAAAAAGFGERVEINCVGCFGACGKGPNIGLCRGDGSGISLEGMSEAERLRRTFMGVKPADPGGVGRVVQLVDAWLQAEPAREAAAKAAFNDDPDLTLDDPSCEASAVALLVKRLSGRDMSTKGYSFEKLLALLKTRCGPLGPQLAAEVEATVTAEA
ncbi:unnamed protein product [Polarella glacialis]|uniref:Uncharacterized protein n=1 Tax=Polarella glacialis TaxID=89957 RepID=A0A813GH82_POLGL|nr:unnamed protein product [Polarella glacialis]CAE8706458.1 unnamed protein product [Polarella glacialis]